METSGPERFSERDFYRSEFRGRTLAVALPAEASGRLEPVRKALDALAAGGARAVVLAEDGDAAARLLGAEPLRPESRRLEAEVWRRLRVHSLLGLALRTDGAFAVRCRELVGRLGVFKLVWLDAGGGLRSRDGQRQSFVHLAELRGLLAGEGAGLEGPERVPLWREVAGLLEAGIPAVNVCSAEGLDDELFTYAGSGTLFTRERYMTVRDLGVDDFDAAYDLIQRGVEEGYLAPRGRDEVDAVLADGFGAFVESHHLAGIGALLPGADGRSAEIASLYTLTRFLGEGVGGALVAFAIERARALGLAYVYACTTRERVAAFFERQALVPVGPEALPAGKWTDYDPARRAELLCLRLDL